MRFEGHPNVRSRFPALPPMPPPGQLMVSRIPRTQFLKVHWPDGQFRTVVYGRDGDRELAKLGIPAEKLPKLLNYVWNFYSAYVEAPDAELPPPPVEARRTPAVKVPV